MVNHVTLESFIMIFMNFRYVKPKWVIVTSVEFLSMKVKLRLHPPPLSVNVTCLFIQVAVDIVPDTLS